MLFKGYVAKKNFVSKKLSDRFIHQLSNVGIGTVRNRKKLCISIIQRCVFTSFLMQFSPFYLTTFFPSSPPLPIDHSIIYTHVYV